MTDVKITSKDGSGSFAGYLAKPKGTPAAGIVVIQEIFGVNKVMQDICDWLAGEGYLACSPDLFWRLEPGVQLTDQTEEEWQQAFGYMKRFDQDKGIEDLQSTVDFLRNHEDCTGKVGSIGYCLGGRLAFMMATRTDADANVSYYGVGLDDLLGEADSISRPLMLHIASEDEFFPAEGREKVQQELADHPKVTTHVYQGNNHAFAREGGEHYDPQAAETANSRTLAFLKSNLS